MSTTLERPELQSQPQAKPVTKLRMQVVESLAHVEPKVIDAWREMTENPMGSPDWLLPWWKYYGRDNDQLQLVLFFDHEELVSVSPLYLENGKHLKMLGSGKVCSDHSELFIARQQWHQPVSSMFFDWLNSSDAPAWHSMQLEAIDSFGSSSQIVSQWKDSVSVHIEAGDSICSIPLPESWDDYLASLSKNHR